MRTTQRPQGVHAGQRRLRPRGRRSRPDDSTDLTRCDTSQPSEGDPMAVTHVVNCLVFDGTGADLRDGLVVTFEDSRIVEVGVQRPSRDDVVLDAEGRTVLPGLINANTHLGGVDIGAGGEPPAGAVTDRKSDV